VNKTLILDIIVGSLFFCQCFEVIGLTTGKVSGLQQSPQILHQGPGPACSNYKSMLLKQKQKVVVDYLCSNSCSCCSSFKALPFSLNCDTVYCKSCHFNVSISRDYVNGVRVVDGLNTNTTQDCF